MGNILEYLQRGSVKPYIIESKNYKDFVDSAPLSMIKWWSERDKYGVFERAYWTVKNHPSSYHAKVLRYPNITKLSEVIKNLHYQEKTNPRQSLKGTYIRQSNARSSKFGDVLKNQEQQKNRDQHFVTACCDLQDGIEIDVIEAHRGCSIELIDREEGLLVIAHSRTMIGSDWLAIVKEFDVELGETIILKSEHV